MAHRYPLESAPDPNARCVIEESMGGVDRGNAAFPIVDEDEGAMLGWLGPMSYTLDIFRGFCDLGNTAYSKVSPRIRELVIMSLLSVVKEPYMTSCHRAIGVQLGLTEAECEEALAGRVSQSLSEVEAAAYQVGKYLATLDAPVDDATWRVVSSKLSKEKIATVANIMGGYKWIVLLTHLNGDNTASFAAQSSQDMKV